MAQSECSKCCSNCINYDLWFGACFALENGNGDPFAHNFRDANFGNRDGMCDLHTSIYEDDSKGVVDV